MPKESVRLLLPPVLFTITPGTTYNLVESYTVPEIIICEEAMLLTKSNKKENSRILKPGKILSTSNITVKQFTDLL